MKTIAILTIFITTFIQYVAVHADVGALREDRNLAGCDTLCQNCKEICKEIVVSCGNPKIFKCNMGGCLSLFCKSGFFGEVPPGSQDECTQFCQYLVSDVCTPGDPSESCLKGFSVGQCYQDLNCLG